MQDTIHTAGEILLIVKHDNADCMLHVFNGILNNMTCSPVNFHVLQSSTADTKKTKDQDFGRKTNIHGQGIESGTCVKFPQSFTDDRSATGKTPETAAMAKPEGERSVFIHQTLF